MSNITQISDVLGFLDNKRKEILPEYQRAGKPVYSLRNYADITDLDAEVMLNGGSINLAEKVPMIGRTGNLLRTPRTSYAVNLDIAFDNRVKVAYQEVAKGKTEKVYTFVVDQRALMEQKTGHIYANYIVGFVIGKSEDGTPEVRGTVHITEDEFVNEFDTSFDVQAMEEVMELINKYRVEHGTSKVIKEISF